jgi:hypothetical protein
VESVTQRVPTPEKDPAWEGSLNHHASELRVLADRVEQINEWLELDWIVEMRMTKDIVDNYRPECHRYAYFQVFYLRNLLRLGS